MKVYNGAEFVLFVAQATTTNGLYFTKPGNLTKAKEIFEAAIFQDSNYVFSDDLVELHKKFLLIKELCSYAVICNKRGEPVNES